MLDVSKTLKGVGSFISHNSTHILTALGCAGLISTAVLTGTAVPKAIRILDQYDKDLTELEKFKHTWQVYIPAGVVGATSIACIVGANTVNAKRNAALAALYSISQTSFADYREKVVDEIGKIKETKIKDEIAQDTIVKNPVGDRSVILTGKGDVLCYDKLSDRYFTSSYETIRQKVNDLNYDLLSDMWLDLNDLYYALGLPEAKLGNLMGFDLEKGKIEVDYSTALDPHGTPCLVIDTVVYPKHR